MTDVATQGVLWLVGVALAAMFGVAQGSLAIGDAILEILKSSFQECLEAHWLERSRTLTVNDEGGSP